MTDSTVADPEPQSRVNSFFRSEASYWEEVYATEDIQGEIYRARAETILRWVEQLPLLTGARVLDVGCGAGLQAVALAKRGMRVDAIDSTDAMVDLARANACRTHTEEVLKVARGDTRHLEYADGSFELVVAAGVIPWLADPVAAIREMARVTAHGGYVILTADNALRLNHLLDPRFHPLLGPVRERLKDVLGGAGIHKRRPDPKATGRFDFPRFVDRLISAAGLRRVRYSTVGFGPFTFLGKRVLPVSAARVVHHRLQLLTDRGVPIIRETGSHTIVLARKP